MSATTERVTFKGSPLTLAGTLVSVGDTAPGFSALANDLSPVTLAALAGKVAVVFSVPSLDTAVCDVETRRFNQEAVKLSPAVEVWCISMDLPFAQARWCGASGVERVRTASDHRDASFGLAYGVLVKELRLLARAVFVIDKAGRVAYKQLVPEITAEPDYAAAVQAVTELVY